MGDVALVLLLVGLAAAGSVRRRLRVTIAEGSVRIRVAPLALAPRRVRLAEITRAQPGHVYRLRGLAFRTGGGTCRTNDGDWVYGLPPLLGLYPLASRWRPQGLLLETKAGGRLFLAAPEWEALGAELARLGVVTAPADPAPSRSRPSLAPRSRRGALGVLALAVVAIGLLALTTLPGRAWRAEQAQRYEGVWVEVALVAPNGDVVPLTKMWGRDDQRAGLELLWAAQSRISVAREVVDYWPPFTAAVAPAPTEVRDVLPIRYRWRVTRGGELETRGLLSMHRVGLSARLEGEGRRLVVTHGTSGGLPLRSVYERGRAAGSRNDPSSTSGGR